MNSAIVKTSLALCLWALAPAAHAAVITLPENELPSESVVPQLDNKTAVLNRTIKKTGRASVGISYGNLLDEMFYNGTVLSFDVRYNTSEMGAWGLRYDQWSGGPTSYTDTFASGTGQLRFASAPARTSGVFLTHSFDLYYGKLSLGKDLITPMQLGWLAMAGAQTYDSDWLPALQGGGQLRMYVNKNLSFDLQYLFSAYQKVDPTSTDVRNNKVPLPSAFTKKLSFGQLFQVGVSYLF